MQESSLNPEAPVVMTADELAEEQRLLRRLQMMMNLVMQTIAQDSSLSIDEASQMIADSRKAALAMFPGKELAYDILWRPAVPAADARAVSDHVRFAFAPGERKRSAEYSVE